MVENTWISSGPHVRAILFTRDRRTAAHFSYWGLGIILDLT